MTDQKHDVGIDVEDKYKEAEEKKTKRKRRRNGGEYPDSSKNHNHE